MVDTPVDLEIDYIRKTKGKLVSDTVVGGLPCEKLYVLGQRIPLSYTKQK